MPRDRSLVRASDLGAWAFCHRAWWLREVKGAAHGDPAVLARGGKAHRAHGRKALVAQRLAKSGVILIAIGLAIIGLFILWQLLG